MNDFQVDGKDALKDFKIIIDRLNPILNVELINKLKELYNKFALLIKALNDKAQYCDSLLSENMDFYEDCARLEVNIDNFVLWLLKRKENKITINEIIKALEHFQLVSNETDKELPKKEELIEIKKPRTSCDGRYENDDFVETFSWQCPICDQAVSPDYEDCPICGTRFDWGDR